MRKNPVLILTEIPDRSYEDGIATIDGGAFENNPGSMRAKVNIDPATLNLRMKNNLTDTDS